MPGISRGVLQIGEIEKNELDLNPIKENDNDLVKLIT
jgi:hypothetical protein